MELPDFDPSGKGPQGTGGIPPESMRQGLQEVAQNPNSGVDLITGSLRVEDTPGVQRVLDNEAQRVLSELGVLPPQQVATAQAPVTPETPAFTQPPVQQQAPVSGPAATAPSSDDLAARIARVKEKYGGNVDEIAKAYVHTDAARTRTQQGAASLESRILAELSEMRTMFTQRQPEPPTMRDFLKETAPPPPVSVPQPTGDDADFYTRVEGIVNKAVQTNLIALKEAEISQKRQEAFQKQLDDSRSEATRLKPIILGIYNEDRALYDSLPSDAQYRLLLKNAKDREMALTGLEIYNEVMGNGTRPGHVGVQPAPTQGASLPSPGSAARIINAPVTPPNGNWGATPGMKDLWSSADGSVDETRKLMRVLAERGIGDHLG